MAKKENTASLESYFNDVIDRKENGDSIGFCRDLRNMSDGKFIEFAKWIKENKIKI